MYTEKTFDLVSYFEYSEWNETAFRTALEIETAILDSAVFCSTLIDVPVIILFFGTTIKCVSIEQNCSLVLRIYLQVSRKPILTVPRN